MLTLAQVLNSAALFYQHAYGAERAVAASNEAVQTYRKLATSDQATYEPYVAQTLGNLGLLYASAENAVRAEAAYDDALQVYHRLIRPDSSEQILMGMAILLGNMATFNRHNNNVGKAESLAVESVSIYRELAQRNGQVYTPYLAIELSDLGSTYQETNRFGDAEKTYNEALQTGQRFAAQSPIYESVVATTSNDLGSLYRTTRRFDDAERLYKQAVTIWQTLAKADPSTYQPELASALTGLGALYASDMGRLTEAEDDLSQARGIYRGQNLTNADSATTLNDLGIVYEMTGRFYAAESVYREALGIEREMAKANPDAYRGVLGLTLSNVGHLYQRAERSREAKVLLLEAVQIQRQLADRSPAAKEPLAESLENMSHLYLALHDSLEAEQTLNETLGIRRELSKKNPEVYVPKVVRTLNEFAVLYRRMGKIEEAENYCKEAIQLVRSLPSVDQSPLAMALHSLGNIYLATARLDAAEAEYNQALEIYRTLAKQNPAVYDSDVANTLGNLATLYGMTGRLDEAEKVYVELLGTRRRLTEENPLIYKPDLADELENRGNLYVVTGRSRQAESDFQEVLAIRRETANSDPAVYEPDLARTLTKLAVFYAASFGKERAREYAVEALAVYHRISQHSSDFNEQLAGALFLLARLDLETHQDVSEVCTLALEAERVAAEDSAKELARRIASDNCH